MTILRKFGRVFDLIELGGAYVGGGLIIIIMLLTSSEIVMRYFLQSPTFWTLESSRLSLLYVTF